MISFTRTLPAILLLIGFAFLISFRGLNEPDEGRYLEIAREMLTSGDFLVPRLKGVPHYAKPPMTYWAIATSMSVFGVNEFGARLPGLLAALLVVLVLRDLLIRMNGRQEDRLLLVLFLASTFEFFALSNIVTTDMLLCATIVVAMWARWNALNESANQGRWRVIFWLALGLGFLIKGPIIAMVVFLGLLAAAILERSTRVLTGLGLFWGLPLALSIAAPWFWLVIDQQQGLSEFFFGDEVLGRVQSGRGRSKPFYYFMIVLPIVLLPWTWNIWHAGRRLVAERHEAALFLSGWILGPFLVFSLSASKLWTYMLPLIPPAVLILALGHRAEGRKKKAYVIAAISMMVLLVSLIFIGDHNSMKLGNNNGYRHFLHSIPSMELRGQDVSSVANLKTSEVKFSDRQGAKIATYRFRCLQASFYLLGDSPEFVPIYGNKSLWEWEDMQSRDTPGTLADLLAELQLPEEFVVLTKMKYVSEIEAALGRQLRVLADSGQGSGRVVALSNQ
ncbi:MAG: 4-amino-4-deoxy-L-arabinose transferase-like glycosyltransferase [Planctomycetota bacterium]